MRAVERSDERDAAIAAMLPYVAEHGWTERALRGGLSDRGTDPAAAAWLFRGPLDMVEAYLDLADRRMEAAAADLPPAHLSGRVRALIALRLHQAAPERPAVRRAAAILSLPTNALTAARTLARTVDAIWHAAGDRSPDWSWYSKRGILAGIYSATLLHWLRPAAEQDSDDAGTLEFLDRRLAGVARLGKLSGRLKTAAARLTPARLRDNPPTRATGAAIPAPPAQP